MQTRQRADTRTAPVRRAVFLLAGLVCITAAAYADPARFSDSARVVAVEPLVEVVSPATHRRECQTVPLPLLPLAPTPGEDIRRQQALVSDEAETECRWVEGPAVERIDGYRVTYAYAGQFYTRRMDHPPGESLSVRVELEPEPLSPEPVRNLPFPPGLHSRKLPLPPITAY